MEERAKIRLYIDEPLAVSQLLSLSQDHAHYLFGVMRLSVGDFVAIFNGRDGEWRGEIIEAGKRKGIIRLIGQSSEQIDAPDLWLIFAPIKKARTDFIAEKATEMGVSKILPVLTDFTNSDRVRAPRLQSHAIEAAEQCGGTFVPDVAEPQKLAKLLDRWDPERRILFCDESQVGVPLDLPKKEGPWAILIGPEGGFSPREIDRLRSLEFVHSMSLGPRILRADTAAVAALTLWQTHLGDWT